MSEEFETVKAGGLEYDIIKMLEFGSNRKLHKIAAAGRDHPTLVATMAFDMVLKWGMVAGMPDGEDSSGRSKVRLAEPAELVDRAFLCAEAAVEMAKDRGHMLALPSLLPDDDIED